MSTSLRIVIEPVKVVNGIALEQIRLQVMDSNLKHLEMDKDKQGQTQDPPNSIPHRETDDIRFAICPEAPERDISLDIQRLQRYRYLYNKLWKVATSALMYFPQDTVYKTRSAPLSESLSSLDRWMLSRVSFAVQRVNCGFKNYDFPSATKHCYNLWLYDLRHIYLEYLKPVFAQGSASEKAAARQTLYTTLEVGLKLLSPFMPNLSAKLYKKLPRGDSSNTSFPSFGVAEYPNEAIKRWRSAELEANVETSLKIIKLIRSTRTEYNLSIKQKTIVHIVTEMNEIKEVFRELQFLAYSELSDDSPPRGCSMLTVSDKMEVHLVLKGLINPQKEITKFEKKKENLLKTRKKLQQAVAAHDYMVRVPSDVQKLNTEKLSTSQGEIKRIEAAIETLKLM